MRRFDNPISSSCRYMYMYEKKNRKKIFDLVIFFFKHVNQPVLLYYCFFSFRNNFYRMLIVAHDIDYLL